LALLEEAKHRLKVLGITEALGVQEGEFYVWVTRARKAKLGRETREKIITELEKTQPPEANPQSVLLRAVRDLGDKIDALAPPGRRRVRRGR